MAYKDYKHILTKPNTHQRLKIYCAENKIRSFDDAINKLLEVAAE